MRGDVIEIRARGTILLIGGAGALAGLPATLRQRSAGVSAVQHLAGDTQALQGLRHFWLRRSHPRSIIAASDRDLLGLVAAGVAHGDLDAVVLPSHHARGQAVALSSGACTAAGRATRAAAAPPRPRIVARMSPEERLAEVLRRAAARLPRAMGNELLSLVTPDSIAAALGLAVFGAAANLTPFGWAADVILAAIAFGFGGLAAVHALGDLATCFERIADAESERDLDEAAEALARAASAITVAGLAAILHEKARRWGGGGERVQEVEPPKRPRLPSGPPKTLSVQDEPPIKLPVGKRPVDPEGVEAATRAQIARLLAKAPAATAEIDQIAKTLASRFGGRVAPGPIKSEQRIFEKAMADYGGDASRVTDVARNTIVVDQEHVAAAAKALSQQGAKVKVVSAEDNAFGYSGVIAKLKTKSGLTAEIQINTPQMIFAKEKEENARKILGDELFEKIKSTSKQPGGQGHVIYEEARRLPSDSLRFKELAEKSLRYYSDFR